MTLNNDTPTEPDNTRFVVLAEPGQRMRLTLREILIGQGFLIVGEASIFEETLELCKKRKPALVILNDHLDNIGFIPMINRLQAACPGVGIILLSDAPTDKAIFLASRSASIDILEKPVNRLKLLNLANTMTGNAPVSNARSNKYYL